MALNGKFMLVISVNVCVLLCLFVFRSTRKQEDTFIVGMMSSWPPFMNVNTSGDFEGFDVDVARCIANKLGKKLEVRDFGSLATLLIALQQNKIDCIMSGLDITTKRLDVMDMVPYTGQALTSFSLLFWKDIPDGIRSLNDIESIDNCVICVEPGSAQAKFLDQFPLIKKKSLSKIEDMILDIKYGKSLAMIVEPRVAKLFIGKVAELKKLEIPLTEDFKTFGMGIAFTKNNPLAVCVEKIVHDLRESGKLQELENTWQLNEEE